MNKKLFVVIVSVIVSLALQACNLGEGVKRVNLVASCGDVTECATLNGAGKNMCQDVWNGYIGQDGNCHTK